MLDQLGPRRGSLAQRLADQLCEALAGDLAQGIYRFAAYAPSRRIDHTFHGGIITAVIAFFIGALWVSVISNIGIAAFVDTLGAFLAPLYGILVADYYLVRKQNIDVEALFSSDPDARYHYNNGWNMKAIFAFAIAALFSVATVWVPALSELSGYGWVIGAVLGGVLHLGLMRLQTAEAGKTAQ